MKTNLTFVLLPGMHGTPDLFRPLLDILPKEIETVLISYPENERDNFSDIVNFVTSRLPTEKDFVLLAESFSGPVAIAVAAQRPPGLRGLILSATFLQNPVGLLRWTPDKLLASLILNLPLAEMTIRLFLTGDDLDPKLLETITNRIRSLNRPLQLARLRIVRSSDVRADLERVEIPILFLSPTRDRLVRRHAVAPFRNREPKIRFREVESPHMVFQHSPEACWSHIRDFLGAIAL